MKLCILLLLAATLLFATSAQAQICYTCHNIHGTWISDFHGQGVAHCNMCHTMHNSQDGGSVDPGNVAGNRYLLRDASPSDLCLTCHADWISDTFTADPMNPPDFVGGGNFVFLLENNLNDGYAGDSNPISGDAAGHNIIAPAYGSGEDATLSMAPGGTYPSSALSCTSCHDPHGNMNFRMLYGAEEIQGGLYEFESAAPIASGASIYHGRETNSRHTAYQSGVSTWCGNCHPDFHDSGNYVHATDLPLGDTIASYYNSYNGTDDPYSGSPATAYLALVPFEDIGNVDIHSTAGPSGGSRVMCLSCHRAHATSAPDAGRWDFNVTFLHEDGVNSGSFALPDPYLSVNQRSLCNKCHRKDEFDLLE